MKKITLLSENGGERIDSFIASSLDEVSRSYAAALAEEGRVFVGGRAVKKNYKTRAGDVIIVELPEPEQLDVVAEDIPLNIVYEDNDLIVINKPQGMVVHPAAGNYTGTACQCTYVALR